MSTATAQRLTLTHNDYLRLEAESDIRHEYLSGEIFSMAGGSERHALISMNTGAALVNAARTLPCRVYGADMKLYIQSRDHFCYPDVMLLCAPGLRHEQHVEQPSLIIEVLSPTTSAYDRGQKFEHYRTIATLEYYLLLEQDRPHAELFERLPEGAWKLTETTSLEASVSLPRLGLSLPLTELYRQVEWPAPDTALA